MRKKIDEERIKKFHEDRKVLNYMNDVDIAREIGISKSNYSNYINGRIPLSNNFIKRFYDKFEEEIRSEREKNGQNFKEADNSYVTLSDRVEALEQKLEQVRQDQQEISTVVLRIEEKVDRLLSKGRK